MVILHIASIKNDQLSGVGVAVPQHIIEQSRFCTVGFININNVIIDSISEQGIVQIKYRKNIHLNNIDWPFCKPDLVVFHECYRIDYIQISKELISKKIPYILVPHGELRNEAQRKKWVKKKIANTLLFNNFIKNSLAIQCLSQAELESTKFKGKKFIGTNGVKTQDKVKTHYGRVKHFLYIGRYEWRVKGLDLLFQAINKTSSILKNCNCTFDLYGPNVLGRMEEVCKLVKDNDVEQFVKIHEEIIGQEKENRLLEADIFIQCSRHEGMPMGILEALSYGIPCITTKGTTLSELICKYDAGWGCETNVDALTESISKAALASNQIMFQKGINARHMIEDLFCWEKVAGNTIKKYKELLNSNE